MTWMYVPETSCPSAQASEALNLASNSLSDCAANRLAEYATWKGSAQQPQAWSRRWKQGGFIRLLSGLTCSPSTLDLGVASFISSLRAIPAKITALPESAPDQAESDSSLPKSAVSPTSAGLILSSAKTCRGTRTDNSQPSSRHWSDWATALRQEYSARPKPVIPCDANDCSSWPSAKVARGGYEVQRDGSLTLTLEGAAAMWMTPMTADTGEKVTHATKQYSLIQQTERDFTLPPSSQDQPIAGGAMSSTDSPNSNQPSVRRKLNPIFVEALMRWPTGLSGFERQEMAWILWWHTQLSFASSLCLQEREPQQGSLF